MSRTITDALGWVPESSGSILVYDSRNQNYRTDPYQPWNFTVGMQERLDLIPLASLPLEIARRSVASQPGLSRLWEDVECPYLSKRMEMGI